MNTKLYSWHTVVFGWRAPTARHLGPKPLPQPPADQRHDPGRLQPAGHPSEAARYAVAHDRSIWLVITAHADAESLTLLSKKTKAVLAAFTSDDCFRDGVTKFHQPRGGETAVFIELKKWPTTTIKGSQILTERYENDKLVRLFPATGSLLILPAATWVFCARQLPLKLTSNSASTERRYVRPATLAPSRHQQSSDRKGPGCL
jgi:hypothetical protein